MRQSTRLQSFYFVFFLSSSGILAFRNVYFRSVGLSGGDMGLVGAALLVVGIVAQPVWGLLSDRLGAQKRVVLIALAVSGALSLAFPPAARVGVLALVGLTIAFAAFQSPVRPVANSLVLSAGYGYGTVRAFGSIAFGVGTLAYGLVLARTDPSVLFYVYAVGAALAFFVVLRTPVGDGDPLDGVGRRVPALLRNRSFAGLLAATFVVGIVLSANNSYFVFFVNAVGGGNETTGAAFAVKTTAEAIAFLAFVRAALSRRLLFVAGGLAHAAVFSMYVLGGTTAAVIAVQPLLGVGYAAVMTAVVELADELSPDELGATAQTALTALGIGLGGATGELLSGALLDVLGIFRLFGGYAVVAVVSVVVFLATVDPGRVTRNASLAGGDD
ncbi:MFS transporter [Halogeometricum borinquense]|uniref:MFS transporter n=1 Tax=Halogeometricum borinquense TaxID=60847 RepID=A0A6C0UNG1_9EURY|nr:MFS transporter [Halogeometricum borinquense]QIB74468.1 MFS transporter [Halogeometricum borinquense]